MFAIVGFMGKWLIEYVKAVKFEMMATILWRVYPWRRSTVVQLHVSDTSGPIVNKMLCTYTYLTQ